jgi:DNA mismatch repair protein MutL
VVKELLENAIDAGADTVTVEIKNGGVSLIRLTDNGCGISYEDVPAAFLRHATSKVRTEVDLESISTLGFRGEALASIAAVADVKIITCTGEGNGTVYRITGGEEREYDEIGAPKGTTITVSDLFFNVPARMKFLKKDVSEGNAVAGVVQRLALSHPEVSVRFIRDGREEMLTPGDGELRSCIYAVLGRDFAANLVPVEYENEGVKVTGFCCKPSATRANRTMQHFFINGRYVKTNTAAVALERAYHGLVMVGRFPACVLHIELPVQAVDVNVHPAKIEVRFVNEKPVFDAVYHGVRAALQSGDTIEKAQLPQVHTVKQPFVNTQVSSQPQMEQRTFAQIIDKPVSPQPRFVPSEPTVFPDSVFRVDHQEKVPAQLIQTQEVTPPVEVAPKVAEPVEEITQTPVEIEPKVIGEVFATYILAEYGDEMLVIDKHAAHERILYNELKENATAPACQMLLEPVAVSLDSDECNALLTALPLLTKAGYVVEDFGRLTVLVRGVPMMVSGLDVTSVIQEIAGGLASGKRDVMTAKEDWIYHSVACRAAIKAGDKTAPQEWKALVQRVVSDKQVRYCPHGRPVCFVMTKRDLEKQFGRIL